MEKWLEKRMHVLHGMCIWNFFTRLLICASLVPRRIRYTSIYMREVGWVSGFSELYACSGVQTVFAVWGWMIWMVIRYSWIHSGVYFWTVFVLCALCLTDSILAMKAKFNNLLTKNNKDIFVRCAYIYEQNASILFFIMVFIPESRRLNEPNRVTFSGSVLVIQYQFIHSNSIIHLKMRVKCV